MSPNELHTDIAVLKQQHMTMNKTIDRIEQTQKEGFNDIKQAINGLDKTFATKAEHQENSFKIDSTAHRMAKIEKGIWWVIATVASVLITAILYTILK